MESRWVSDSILKLLGAADDTTTSTVINIAELSKSQSSFLSQLLSFGFPNSEESQVFATTLYNKTHPEEEKKRGKNENGSLKSNTVLNRQAMYDEEESDMKSTETFQEIPKLGGAKRRQKDTNGGSWSDESASESESESEPEPKPRPNPEDNDSKEDDSRSSSRSRSRSTSQDQKERDEFVKRLQQKSKNDSGLVENRSGKQDSSNKLREKIAEDVNNHRDEISQLRTAARQQYLTRREQDQLILFQKEMIDRERDVKEFGWDNLTKREQDELKEKRALLDIINQRKQIDDSQGYMLPEDYITEKGKIDLKRKQAALYQRYNDNYDKVPTNDYNQWENEQVAKTRKISKNHHNSKKQENNIIPEEDEYEFVFDTSQNIGFIDDEGKDISSNFKLSKDDIKLLEQIKQQEAKIKTIQDVQKSLPVYHHRDDILNALKEYQIMIIVGDTGSGKTTQIPQYLHQAGYTKNGMKIGCTQPRRVAAMSVATRVAEEMGVRLGNEVGYSIRFEDKSCEKTVIKYMTDGMLLREFLTDPELSTYSALIIDEAHERTLHTDILFGLVKDIARYRPELKLLISSATIDAQKFSNYFDKAPIYKIEGKTFPVDHYYTPQPEANYLQAAIQTVFQIHASQGDGDILVFLTGQDEIETMGENLSETCRKLGNKIKPLIICPIYANLPAELQSKIFEPTPKGSRKVVLATNIAETSITIDGVAFVIDPGFVKENVYNPKTGMESLVVTPCSRASSDQRAGRAGRVGPGKCFHLYTKWAFLNEMPKTTSPEILRTNLSSVVLLLMSLGINDLIHFDFMDSPPNDMLIKSLELLYALGALNHKGELTKIGRQQAEFPTDPMVSKAIIASDKFNCVDEVISIMSMLGESSALFYRPKLDKVHADKAKESFTRPDGGDHLVLLEIWNQWIDTGFSKQWAQDNFLQYKNLCRARDVRDQLVRLCERVEIDIDKPRNEDDNVTITERIMKSIVSGFFPNTARLNRNGENYKSIKTKSETIYIHPSSVIFPIKPLPKWVLYNELVLTSKEFMRNCMPIKSKWLMELAPHYFKEDEIEKYGFGERKMPKSRN